MLRRAITLCLLLIVTTGLSARVRVAACEDPRTSVDIVFAIDDAGYVSYVVGAEGWIKLNEAPCPTDGAYDIDIFYDPNVEDMVVLVVDGEGRVYAASTEGWIPITETPAKGEQRFLISAFYYDGNDMELLTLLDAGGQLFAWYWAEEYYESVMPPLPEAESYSIADHFTPGDDSYQLHAVDSAGAIYTFLADGWHEYPVTVEGEPPYQIGILDTSTGLFDLIVSAEGTLTFVKDATEKADPIPAMLSGKPPYDYDVTHSPGTDNYRSYLIDSDGALFTYDGENWLQVVEKL